MHFILIHFIINALSISSKNKHFSIIDNKYILCKSYITINNFDDINGTVWNTEHVINLSYIKIIGSKSFINNDTKCFIIYHSIRNHQ